MLLLQQLLVELMDLLDPGAPPALQSLAGEGLHHPDTCLVHTSQSNLPPGMPARDDLPMRHCLLCRHGAHADVAARAADAHRLAAPAPGDRVPAAPAGAQQGLRCWQLLCVM